MSEVDSQEAPRPLRQLHSPARLQLAEHAFARYAVTAELGTSPADIMAPEYFAHFATRFNPYDEITVRVDDGTWYATYVVLSVGRSWVKTALLNIVELSSRDVEQTQAADYDVLYRGPTLRFSVIRKSDKSVVKDKFTTKADAHKFIAEQA